MKKKIILTILLWGASAFDGKTTSDMLRNPRHYEMVNPFLGRRPSDMRLVLTGSGFIAGETFLLWKAKNKKLKTATEIAIATQVGTHIALGIHNTKLR